MNPVEREKVIRQIKFKMSNSEMAKFMYAIIVTTSEITSSCAPWVEKRTRNHNARNEVDMLIKIRKSKIKQFEELVSIQLKEYNNKVTL